MKTPHTAASLEPERIRSIRQKLTDLRVEKSFLWSLMTHDQREEATRWITDQHDLVSAWVSLEQACIALEAALNTIYESQDKKTQQYEEKIINPRGQEEIQKLLFPKYLVETRKAPQDLGGTGWFFYVPQKSQGVQRERETWGSSTQVNFSF